MPLQVWYHFSRGSHGIFEVPEDLGFEESRYCAETVSVAQDLNTNGTAGQLYAYALLRPHLTRCHSNNCQDLTSVCCRYGLLVNDEFSNSTIGVLQGFTVVLRTHVLAHSVFTLTTAEGTMQVASGPARS